MLFKAHQSFFATMLYLWGTVSRFVSAHARARACAGITLLLLALPLGAQAQDNQANEPVKKARLSLSTNLLVEAASAFTDFHVVPVNIGIEFPVSSHWSLFSDYIVTAPWRYWNQNAECAQMMQLHFGCRRYLSTKRALGGWFVYGQAGAGYYDYEHLGKGYQGEDILASAGIGYRISLGSHLRINLSVGAGPAYTQYRYYELSTGNEHLLFRNKGNRWYFGLTDAKIGLTWIFYRKTR